AGCTWGRAARSSSRGGDALAPLVGADQLASRYRMRGSRVLRFLDLGRRAEPQLVDRQREQLELIMVRWIAFGRAGAGVPAATFVVDALSADLLPGGDRSRTGGNVEHRPMTESAPRRVGIVD